ncbi:DUF4386 family protein [Flocculibacter collagenilyticus]|uniref:DUF4386 family protein n=1 Tax=Flocculibacter collagenilyticus TaxID=2744479 RepID=UPI0018F3C4AA|nr:DUF4386 family protein [Flocculibacter collagenilyticus]
MEKLQKLGGMAALIAATLYLAAFIYFGAFLSFPPNSGTTEKFAYLSENQVIISAAYFISYVLFGIVLAVLVQALHERLKVKTPHLSQYAAVFGYLWVGLVIASGMITNIGLNQALELAKTEPTQAMAMWKTINIVVDGIGGGNEIVGGLWTLILSLCALKHNLLSKPLNYLGLFVGIAGILTVYPSDILTATFGISQLIWFAWLGIIMLKTSQPAQLSTSEKPLSEKLA